MTLESTWPKIELKTDPLFAGIWPNNLQLKGLNTKRRKYSLPFNKRTDQAVTNILNFLSSSTGGNNGAKSFTWTPPYGLTGKWICENISVTNVAHNLNDLTLDFTEVFETE